MTPFRGPDWKSGAFGGMMEAAKSVYYRLKEALLGAYYSISGRTRETWIDRLPGYMRIDMSPEISDVMSFSFLDKEGSLVESGSEIRDIMSVHQKWRYKRRSILDSPYISEAVFLRTAFEDWRNPLYNNKDVLGCMVKELNRNYLGTLDMELYSEGDYPHARAVVGQAYVYPKDGAFKVRLGDVEYR